VAGWPEIAENQLGAPQLSIEIVEDPFANVQIANNSQPSIHGPILPFLLPWAILWSECHFNASVYSTQCRRNPSGSQQTCMGL
jgi:hypothetical protein